MQNIQDYFTQEQYALVKEKSKDIRALSIEKVMRKFQIPFYSHNQNGKEVRNCLDMLMYTQGKSYLGALHEISISFDIAKLPLAPEKEEIAPHEKAKAALIKEQFQALGYPYVRIQAVNPHSSTKINLGKPNKNAFEIFYNYKQAIGKIKQLSKLNADGCNIYITPVEHICDEKNSFYLLIDDVHNFDGMRSKYGEPNLVLESSQNSFQAIYKLKNTIDYNESERSTKAQRKKYINLFYEANWLFGDMSISGLRHPFRLAGFSNKKAGKNNFFTRIVSFSEETHKMDVLLESNKQYYDRKSKSFKASFFAEHIEMSNLYIQKKSSITPPSSLQPIL